MESLLVVNFKISRKLLVLFFGVLACSVLPIDKLHGMIRFEDGVFPEFVVSGRALAMGNAYISKVDDASSSFYNPAGLGTVRNTHLHLSNFYLETNKGWLDASTSGSLLDAFSSFPQAISLEGTRKVLLEQRGKLSHSRFQVMPNFTTRYLSAGYMLSKQTRAYLGHDATDLFEYSDRLDHGPYGSLNLSIMGGVFKVGATGVFLNRKETYGEADANTKLDLQADDYYKGSALIIIVGGKLTLPIFFLPTFSATLRNATNQVFTGGSGLGTPDDIKKTYDVGFSLTPQIGKTTRVHLEVNYKDVSGENEGVSQTRRIVFGSEFDFARIMFVRFGYGDGFGSAGIGIKSQRLEFDLTTYAVDTTGSDFRGQEDRRFLMSFSYGL